MNSPENLGGDEYAPLSAADRHYIIDRLATTDDDSEDSAHTMPEADFVRVLGLIVEGGEDLPPHVAAHLRKMLALTYGYYLLTTDSIREDRSWDATILSVAPDELTELTTIADNSQQPSDAWQAASQDIAEAHQIRDTGDPIVHYITQIIETLR